MVKFDETRRAKPTLMASFKDTASAPPKWTMKVYPLPQKSEPLFFKLPWFPRN